MKHKQKKREKVSRKKDAKEVAVVVTTVSLRESEEVFIREMIAYVEKLKLQQKNCKHEARREAKVALIRTGVLTEDGKAKEKIVTWE